jgi:hypothetical protein
LPLKTQALFEPMGHDPWGVRLLIGLFWLRPTKKLKGISKVNSPGIFWRQVQGLNRANPLSNEHGPLFWIKGAVTGKDNMLRAKEI